MLIPKSLVEFINDLRNTDLGRKLLLERDKQIRAARQQLVERYAAETVELERLGASRAKRLRPLQDAELEALAAVRSATAARFAMEATIRQEIHAIEQRRNAIERDLIAGADPQIDQALAALQQRVSGLRQKPPMFDEKNRKLVSNKSSIDRLLQTCQAARDALNQLKLATADHVDARIADILVPVDTAWSHVDDLAEHTN